MINQTKKQIIVLGNGMVGYKFCEKLVAKDTKGQCHITVFGEEPRPAYDRVQLSAYFSGKTVEDLTMAPFEWYEENGIDLYVNEKVYEVNREEKYVVSEKGRKLYYDALIMATGSIPFIPPIPGVDKKGVFPYRTIEDLNDIMAYARSANTGVVIGGGLLGLEAAKALVDLKVKTHVVEFAPRLMPRQIDQTGSDFLKRKIEDLGVSVHLSKNTQLIEGEDAVRGMRFADETVLETDMIVVSAGIKPRDDVARAIKLEVGERGGIVIDSQCRTSDPNIYAIGECALYNKMIYGLVAPGYQMAEVVASSFVGEEKEFAGADMSTKLKLMGVDVGSFGNPFAEGDHIDAVIVNNSISGVYKKILVDRESKKLVGGILIGDASQYGQLLPLCQAGTPVPETPETLLLDRKLFAGAEDTELPDSAGVCSCENITKGEIVEAYKAGAKTIADLKKCTKAGTGCGGCVPLMTDILNQEIKKAGGEVKQTLCSCFNRSRIELAEIIRTEKIRNYWEVLGRYGTGRGCEICKPTVASILASYQNEYILQHQNIQDTNDQFLANIQKNGSYSVVPRVPGGEIKPEQLIAIGEIAKEFDLYTKITGGQRIDMFGAKVEQLPAIWKKLRDVGLESGHAYAKALRTVKSCVGSTWCRFGVQDSVGLAIRIENRYKGLRAPHKIKSAVSGCSRECAEAQSKDFGVIATDKGYNLYICGNGGMKPQHAKLFAEDLDEETLIKYIDRFLMFYVRTADKLTRTATWLNKFEGGIKRLKEIIIADALGICQELEEEMAYHVATYECEWSKTLNDPRMMNKFKPFINTVETDETVKFVPERGQKKPLDPIAGVSA
ncbi:MAG: nitrite reductase large subunit NirB [Candidatus Omnitrophica bacterium]|nr:nitrite reductase large subunit NirB [Candidatus Omnitrophota bacterium]